MTDFTDMELLVISVMMQRAKNGLKINEKQRQEMESVREKAAQKLHTRNPGLAESLDEAMD